jgi:hypothetical protein
MPHQFDFDSTNRILRCRLDGRVTDEELYGCYQEIEAYSTETDPLAGIMDFSGVTSLDVSPKTIRDLARLPPAMPNPARPRVLVAISPPVFGLARMFELHGQDTRPNLHVVRTEKETFAILGIQGAKFEPIRAK